MNHHLTSSQKLRRCASRQARFVWKSLGQVDFGSKKFGPKIFLSMFSRTHLWQFWPCLPFLTIFDNIGPFLQIFLLPFLTFFYIFWPFWPIIGQLWPFLSILTIFASLNHFWPFLFIILLLQFLPFLTTYDNFDHFLPNSTQTQNWQIIWVRFLQLFM